MNNAPKATSLRAQKPLQNAIALFSDIHANIDAFRAVLDDATSLGVSRFYGLGDIVGYGPEPGECVQLARERFIHSVLGHHEGMLLSSETDCDGWGESIGRPLKIARRQLTGSEEMKWLEQLPLVIVENDFMLVHASPYLPIPT